MVVHPKIFPNPKTKWVANPQFFSKSKNEKALVFNQMIFTNSEWLEIQDESKDEV